MNTFTYDFATPSTFMAFAAQSIDKDGYHKTKEANATAAVVRSIVTPGFAATIETAETDAIIAWVDTKMQGVHSDYMDTLAKCVHAEPVEDWMVGYLCSAVASYRRDMERKAEREAEDAADIGSDFIGAEGTKVSFRIAGVKVVSERHDMDDYNTMLKLSDGNGNSIIWNCRESARLKYGIEDFDQLVGMTITGKVKANTEYHGVKRSRIWYCKVA